MSRCAILSICSDKSKVKVTVQGQMLKFLQKDPLGEGIHFIEIRIYPNPVKFKLTTNRNVLIG